MRAIVGKTSRSVKRRQHDTRAPCLALHVSQRCNQSWRYYVTDLFRSLR
jgi:hypothetical protein